MRRIVASTVLMLAGYASAVTAQTTSAVEEQIKDLLFKRTSVAASVVQDAGLSTCLDAEVYRATVTQQQGGGGSSSNSLYAKTKTGLVELSRPSSEADMPELLALIKPGFTLKGPTDAVAMLSAIKVLYVPKSSFSSEIEPKYVQKGNTWQFITGTFFEKLSGVVMDTDATGKITKISFSLTIAK